MLTDKVEMHHFEKACDKMSYLFLGMVCRVLYKRFLLTNKVKTPVCFNIDFLARSD